MLYTLLLLISSSLAGDTVWAIEDVQSTRFPDADTPGLLVEAGDELEIVYREGDRIRIKKSIEFGWIPADKVTEEAPAEDAEEPSPGPTFDFKLPE